MIKQQRKKSILVNQILEVVFFSFIFGAFVLFFPMRANANDSQLKQMRLSTSVLREQSSFVGEQNEMEPALSSEEGYVQANRFLDWAQRVSLDSD